MQVSLWPFQQILIMLHRKTIVPDSSAANPDAARLLQNLTDSGTISLKPSRIRMEKSSCLR